MAGFLSHYLVPIAIGAGAGAGAGACAGAAPVDVGFVVAAPVAVATTLLWSAPPCAPEAAVVGVGAAGVGAGAAGIAATGGGVTTGAGETSEKPSSA